MQSIGVDIIEQVSKFKMKKLEENMREILSGESSGIMVCPYCNYSSRKNRKGSAKIFESNGQKSFKCFSCGIWRGL